MYYISQLIFQRAKVLQIMKTAKHFAIKMQKRRRLSAVSVFLFKFRKYFFLPQISQISQILAAHCHAIAQIFYGLLRLKSLINRRIQSVKSKIIVAMSAGRTDLRLFRDDAFSVFQPFPKFFWKKSTTSTTFVLKHLANR